MSADNAEKTLYRLEGDAAIPSPWTAGPWDPAMQHGGAPAALIAHVADTHPAPAPMQLSRLTVDLSRPVPIAPLRIETHVAREGRNIQTLAIHLYADEKEVVRASALRIRSYPLETPPSSREGAAPKLPETGTTDPFIRQPHPGFNTGVERRLPAGEPAGGRGAVWFRQARPMIEGLSTSPLMAAAAAADYCNGISSPLDYNAWTFINADLTVHFARPPAGDWVLLEAETWLGPDGRALAFGRLADVHGWFGRASQCLVIAKR